MSDVSEVSHGSTQREWDAALDRVRSAADTRGLLLLGAALCRRALGGITDDDCRRVVEAVERLAEHPQVDCEDYTVAAEADAAMECLQQRYSQISEAAPGIRGAYLAAMACGGLWHDPAGLIADVAEAAAIAVAGCNEGPAWEAERTQQVMLFRTVLGTSF